MIGFKIKFWYFLCRKDKPIVFINLKQKQLTKLDLKLEKKFHDKNKYFTCTSPAPLRQFSSTCQKTYENLNNTNRIDQRNLME